MYLTNVPMPVLRAGKYNAVGARRRWSRTTILTRDMSRAFAFTDNYTDASDLTRERVRFDESNLKR